MTTTTNPHKHRTGFARVRAAAGYSIEGLRAAYRGESAFRQEVWLMVIATPLAFWLGQGWVQTALLLGSVLLVLIVELLNSAVEAAIDRISFEKHDLSKHAKDLGSAAVMLALVLSGGIWAAAAYTRFFA
ncbi:diacylglycerol kinase [Pelomonas sp. KK5]|uniref:diacylglycerol kinase n=1 Tax=Pelomonas sp. KK5 TaxID=1855730 RepID=UPI00097C2B17|nr:diacylglycerol kinase [Pelomonas sp. KK5]